MASTSRRAVFWLMVVVCEVLLATAYRDLPPRYVRLNEGYNAFKDYVYDYETTSTILLEGQNGAHQQSLLRLRCQVRLSLKPDYIAVMRFEEPLVLEKNDLDTMDPENHRTRPLREQKDPDLESIRAHLLKPIRFRYNQFSDVESVKVDAAEPAWSINVKKAALQLFHIDLAERGSLEPRQSNSSAARQSYLVAEESALGTCNTLYVVRDQPEDLMRIGGQIGDHQTADLPVFEVRKAHDASAPCSDMPRFNVSNIVSETSNPLDLQPEPFSHTSVVDYLIAGNRQNFAIVKVDLKSQYVVQLPKLANQKSHDVIVDTRSSLRLLKTEQSSRPADDGYFYESRFLTSPLRLEKPYEFLEKETLSGDDQQDEDGAIERLKEISAKFCERTAKMEHDKAAEAVLELSRTLRRIRLIQLKKFNPPCDEIRIPMIEAIIIEKKPKTLETSVELIRSGKMSIDEIKAMFNYLSIASLPEPEELNSLERLCGEIDSSSTSIRSRDHDSLDSEQKWSLKKLCYLTYSSLIDVVCSKDSRRCDGERYAKVLREKLLQEAKLPREEFLFLMAATNAGLPQLFGDLSAIIKDRANLRHPDVIYALRKLTKYPQLLLPLRDLLVEVFTDTQLPEDVRIAAIVLMLPHPTHGGMTMLSEMLSNEPSSQVASLVMSRLNTLGNSTTKVAKLTKAVKHLIDRPESIAAFSHFRSLGNEQLSLDYAATQRREIGPNNLWTKLNLNLLGQRLNPIEINAAVRPVRQHDFTDKATEIDPVREEESELQVRAILRNLGFDRFFDSLKAPKAAHPNNSSDDAIVSYRAHYYLKMFGKVMNFEHADVSDMKSAVNKLVLNLLTSRTEQNDDKARANLLVKVEQVLPTDSGVFVSLSAGLASVVTMKRQVSVNPLQMNVETKLHPVLGLAGELRAAFDLPRRRLGLAAQGQLRLELPLNYKFEVTNKGELQITNTPHSQDVELVKLSHGVRLFEEILKGKEVQLSEKPIAPTSALKKAEAGFTLPFLGCQMKLESTFNARSPLLGPSKTFLALRQKTQEPLVVKIALKTLEDITVSDIMSRLEAMTGVKLSDRSFMNSLLERKDRFTADGKFEDSEESADEDDDEKPVNGKFAKAHHSSLNREKRDADEEAEVSEAGNVRNDDDISSSEEQEQERRQNRQERVKIAKDVRDFDMNEMRSRYIGDAKLRMHVLQIDASVANRKSRLAFSYTRAPRAINFGAYVAVAPFGNQNSSNFQAIYEALLPTDKDFGHLVRSVMPEDLQHLVDMRSYHLIRYGKQLERRVSVQINAHQKKIEDLEPKYEQDETSYYRLKEVSLPSEPRSITRESIALHKRVLEKVPELIQSYKACLEAGKYGYDKCPETKAEYVYSCLAQSVKVDARHVEEENDRNEQIVKVDRCLTQKFVQKLYLPEVSIYVAYDRLPEAASDVLPSILNIATMAPNGHFEPASYRPGRFIAKMRWAADRKSFDVSAHASQFSYKAYAIPSILPLPNRVYGLTPIDSSLNALLSFGKLGRFASLVQPTCRLTVPHSAVSGQEASEGHMLTSWDGASQTVVIPRQRLVVLATTCQSEITPQTLFQPLADQSSRTPIFVAVERDSNERKVLLRVDNLLYRIDNQCQASKVDLANPSQVPTDVIRRHSVQAQQLINSTDDSLTLKRYDDGDCLIRERSTGVEVLFDGHNVQITTSPLRTGFATPFCGLCGEVAADFSNKYEVKDRQVRRERVEQVVSRNCPAFNAYRSETFLFANSRSEMAHDDFEHAAAQANGVEQNNCDVVYKTWAEVNRETNRICFSREAIASCPQHCVAAETRPETIAVTCLPDNAPNRELARRLTLSRQGLAYGAARIYAHPAERQQVSQVPIRCERIE